MLCRHRSRHAPTRRPAYCLCIRKDDAMGGEVIQAFLLYSLPELLRLRPLRSSFSVSMSLVCTHVLKARSARTLLQLRSSVRVRLMLSLTSERRCSSAEIS